MSLEVLRSFEGPDIVFRASPLSPGHPERLPDGSLALHQPTIPTHYDSELRMYVPTSEQAVVATGVSAGPVAFRGITHWSNHLRVPFADRRRGWDPSDHETVQPYMAEALLASVRQQGSDLRALVYVFEKTPGFQPYAEEPFELRSRTPERPLEVFVVRADKDFPYDEIEIAAPRTEPSLAALLARKREGTVDRKHRKYVQPGFQVGGIVMEPTPGCNMRCTYCYLPNLTSKEKMPPEVAQSLAQELESEEDPDISLIWHMGEPLMTGREHMEKLFDPFEDLRRAGRVHHDLQTNATRITREWCEFFEKYDVGIGVSIDGPRWADRQRRTPTGAETFDMAMRGIRLLQEWRRPFTATAVVRLDEIETITENIADYWEFFANDVKPVFVGFNIEEQDGVHIVHADSQTRAKVERFWHALFDSWNATEFKPDIRDFRRVLDYIDDAENGRPPHPNELFVTVGHKGDVSILSPELAHYSGEYYNFIIGRLGETSLNDMLHKEFTKPLSNVTEALAGGLACRATCGYYDSCRGGQLANRVFENGGLGPGANSTRNCELSRREPYVVVTGRRLHSPAVGRQVEISKTTNTKVNLGTRPANVIDT